MATDLDLVRRALGVSRCVFWGMSGGSMIAQVLVHLHPGSVDALILDSAGPCFALTLADPACLMNPAHPRWREERPAWVVRDASGEPLLMAPNEPSDQLRRVVPSLMAFDARSWLGEVRVPTLVVAGAEDEVAPLAQVRALHEALPGSRLAVIEGAGHVPVVQEPDRVGAAVRTFLAEHALR
jgi:3-oxoadipate enol-lactonase